MSEPSEILRQFIAEVRRLLADRTARPVAALRDELDALARTAPHRPAPADQPICAALPELLALGNAQTAAMLALTARLGPSLAWERAPRESTPPAFHAGHAYCMIAGHGGLLPASRVMLGLFLIAPDMFYPNHAHAADEFYYVLAGQAAWQKSGGVFETVGPGGLVVMPSMEPHAIRTGAEPVLILWAWSGDLHGRFVYLPD